MSVQNTYASKNERINIKRSEIRYLHNGMEIIFDITLPKPGGLSPIVLRETVSFPQVSFDDPKCSEYLFRSLFILFTTMILIIQRFYGSAGNFISYIFSFEFFTPNYFITLGTHDIFSFLHNMIYIPAFPMEMQ